MPVDYGVPWISERSVDYFVGLDLAQAQEPTALAIVERTAWARSGSTEYACRELKRWPLGTAYPAIVEEVGAMLVQPTPRGVVALVGAHLIVDTTGVGSSVVALFERIPALGDRLTRVLVSTGHAVTRDGGMWQVPRKELVGVLQTLLQTGRLKIAPGLPETQTLVDELQTFKAKVTLAGKEDLENWREREHDDLVLALAIAIWYAERHEPECWMEFPEVASPGIDMSWR